MNVGVRCGTHSSRSKRQSASYSTAFRARRDLTGTYNITITWDVALDIDYGSLGNLTVEEMWNTLDVELHTMKNNLKENIDKGIFDLTNVTTVTLNIDKDSYQTGWSDIICESGMKARDNTFSCGKNIIFL